MTTAQRNAVVVRLLADATMEPCDEEALASAIAREGLVPPSVGREELEEELRRLHRGCRAAVALRARDGAIWCAVRYPSGELFLGRQEG